MSTGPIKPGGTQTWQAAQSKVRPAPVSQVQDASAVTHKCILSAASSDTNEEVAGKAIDETTNNLPPGPLRAFDQLGAAYGNLDRPQRDLALNSVFDSSLSQESRESFIADPAHWETRFGVDGPGGWFDFVRLRRELFMSIPL